ncbi:hypothetical protein Leryth_009709 [Lithospermum erythrorhizon]|nr:hypothetical protein Leryth_009709 [Lithospermum erythrorhizon]
MACMMRIGSKSEAFHLQGHSWRCISGLPSDVTIEIGDMFFHLHKFPLLSRSGLLEKLIGEIRFDDGSECILQLDEIPGGAKAFELIAKFCYNVRIELTALNVVSVRCAAEYLEMTEDYGEGNLINQTEVFLNDVFCNWPDTIKALETCDEVQSQAEELQIMSRCIDSLATKACTDPRSLNWSTDSSNNGHKTAKKGLCNGIATKSRSPPPSGEDWWYEDVSFLSLHIFKRLIQAVEAAGAEPENVAGALVHYVKKYIPIMNRQSSFKDVANLVKPGTSPVSTPSEADQRAMLEEIVELLPSKKGVTETKFLLRLLRTAMTLQASQACKENLEKMVGMQLDQASLEDLLIPNMGFTVETLYDIDCFQRILYHFIGMDQEASSDTTPCIMEEGQLADSITHSLKVMTRVANLVDAFLADVASDVNLKLPKFQAIAAAIPENARPLSDSLYRAIDIYLKAHPWLTEAEREQICRLMNSQKLSAEASTHAAKNERLPLRVIVQVLFFEQLRLRTSITSWFFVGDNPDNIQDPSGVIATSKNNELNHTRAIQDPKDPVSDLEKECERIKHEFNKLGKKKSWSLFCRRKPCIVRNTPCAMNAKAASRNENNVLEHEQPC